MMFRKKRFGLIKNFSIPARLHTAGFLALMGVLATCYAGYVGLDRSKQGLTASITATTAVLNQKQADMMHDAIRADVLYALGTGIAGDAALKATIKDDLEAHIAAFQAAFATLDTLDLPESVMGHVADVKPIADTYYAAARQITADVFTNTAKGQAEFPVFMESFSALEDLMGVLGNEIEAHGSAAGLAAQVENARYGDIALVSGATAALILIVSNLLIARSITKPLTRVKIAIKEVATGNLGGRHSAFDRASDLRDEVSEIAQYLEILRVRLREALEMEAAIKRVQQEQSAIVQALTRGLEHLSQGDLTQPITTPFPADYEGLRENYNRTLENLNQTIGQVVMASDSIRERSDDISEASNNLASRTQNQAATLEQTAAALDQLTTSVKASAASAKEVEAVVFSARKEAEINGEVVQRAIAAMEGIERSSEQINQIISVIDDIAFQTNLLALNAGVEAARAGDSGRGFAVVASEVRSLAQRSSEASKQIKELISSSSVLVGRGVDAVGGAGRSLASLVGRVTHISELVSGITTSAVQQSEALAEVNLGIIELDQVTQRNAAMVEQSAVTTQSLQQDAFGMNTLVSRFATQAATAQNHDGAVPHTRQRVANMR